MKPVEKKALKERQRKLPLSQSQTSFYDFLFKTDPPSDANASNNIFIFQKNQEILKEINEYARLISNREFVMNTESSSSFWNNNCKEFPILNNLFLALSTINSTSAFVERLFSICGIIRDKRNHERRFI